MRSAATALGRTCCPTYLLAVDALAAGAVAGGEVAALAHEVLDDAVEGGALVVERLAGLAHALLAGAEGAEVLGRLGHDVGVDLEDDLAEGLSALSHLEEHLGVVLGRLHDDLRALLLVVHGHLVEDAPELLLLELLGGGALLLD
jgi:hypothetical protein